jgi:membrane protein implicated in regulation of membrane protease activity
MIQYLSENLWQLWAVLAVACLILELTSGDFFIICFSIGALFAMLAALVGGGFYLQLLLFAVCTVVSIFVVRPVALRYLHRGEDNRLSNADALIGRRGRVSQDIERGGYGRVAIDGDDWKALSASGLEISKGTFVRVVSISSTIVTVEPIDNDNNINPKN